MSFGEFEPQDFHSDFVKFVGDATSGRFLVVVTVEYLLPFDEPVEDVITVWSSPQNLTLPLEACFQSVEAFVTRSLTRMGDGKLVGLSFRHVDGVCKTDLTEGC